MVAPRNVKNNRTLRAVSMSTFNRGLTWFPREAGFFVLAAEKLSFGFSGKIPLVCCGSEADFLVDKCLAAILSGGFARNLAKSIVKWGRRLITNRQSNLKNWNIAIFWLD